MNRPYKPRSLSGATIYVAKLETEIEDLKQALEAAHQDYSAIQARQYRERILLAKLAADSPQFLNPLDAMAATTLRDGILAEMKFNPEANRFPDGVAN